VNDIVFADVVIIEKVSILKVLLTIKNLFDGSHVKKLKEVSVQILSTNYTNFHEQKMFKFV